jgi:AcrR family transcriptional regulator
MMKPMSLRMSPPCIRAAGASRRRGRELEQAIFQATLCELAAVGYAGLTMEGVANRAHTGKAAIYRRWSSKDDLIVDALDNELEIKRDEPPDTGSIRDDLLAMMRAMAAFLVSPAGSAMHAILNECVHGRSQLDENGPEYMIKRRVMEPRRQMVFDALRRGVDRGEVRPTAVCDRVVEVGPALIFASYLAQNGPIDDTELVAIVDEVLVPLVRA